MPYNGSGTFTLYSPGNPVVTGTTISSTWANNTLTDLATGLSTALTKDGQTTPTANIPMGGFKLTGLGAGSANGDSIRWQQSAAGVMTTLGDTLYASAANTPARLAAKADVAAHATTCDPWVARQVILTGSAVTFTDIADAPYVGAEVWIYQNAAHVWTDGAVFSVQGNANYTAAAGDWIRLYATTVSTFDVTVFKATGAITAKQPTTTVLTSGSGTYNTPAGCTYFIVEGWGGGGAGGGGDGTNRGTGGGGGGYFKKLYTSPAASYSYSVGAAAAAVGQGSGGTAGNGTTFDTCTANGGAAGLASNGGAQGGVSGGTATGGDENIQGGASTTLEGSAAQLAAAVSFGGDSPRGGFGGKTNVTTGGQIPGGGGSCANGTGNSGAGARGEIRIWEFYS